MIVAPIPPLIVAPVLGLLADAGQHAWDPLRGSAVIINSIDLATVGTFTRASDGTYLTAAPGDGTTSFISVASSDVRRLENRGDGAGALLLLEKSSTNFILQSRDITSAAAWTEVALGATQTANDGNGPTGAATADRVQSAGAQFSRGQIVSGLANPHTISVWVRHTSATGGHQPAPHAMWNASVSTTYSRQAGLRAATSTTYYPVDTSGAVTPQDVRVDLHQVENGRYPTSAIITAAATVTRAADSLVIPAGGMPTNIWARRHRLAQVSPAFAHTDLASGDARWVFTIDGSNNGLRIRHTGSDVRMEAVQGGSVRASSGALTFARHGLLGIVSWDPVAAVVSVGGVAGSAGTPWYWTPGTVRIGGIQGGSGSELDGRISTTLEAV